MYNGPGTGGRRCICAGQMLRVHSPGRSTFLHEMTSSPPWNCDVVSEILLRQSMRIYLNNNPAKFHPDPIWNNGASGFFEEVAPQEEQDE